MEETKAVRGAKQERQQRLLTLLVLMSLVVFLGLFFSAGPVYADSGTFSLDPGEGATHPNTIEGYVKNYVTGGPVSGMSVYLYIIDSYYSYCCPTDAYGRFIFQPPYDPLYPVQPNHRYELTVNGPEYYLGRHLEVPGWGQWRGDVYTDSIGYAFKYIYLEPAAVVDVPGATLFSNTKYATLSYKMTGTYSFSHIMSFSVPIAGISVGYSTSTSIEYTYIFKTMPLTQSKIVKRHYAATYWDDRKPGVAKTGIAGYNPSWNWDLLQTVEYLNPNNLPYHVEHRIDANRTLIGEYMETGSYTWNYGVPFAIQYQAFSVNINLDTTVTTTAASSTVEYLIDRSGDTNPNTLTFWAYTAGAVLDPDNKRGGMELHVWDMSGAG